MMEPSGFPVIKEYRQAGKDPRLPVTFPMDCTSYGSQSTFKKVCPGRNIPGSWILLLSPWN